jgi:hypothetical protein
MRQGDSKRIRECADKAGVIIEDMYQTKSHYKVMVRGQKAGIVFVSVSPSDDRAYKNVITDMRKVTK